MLQDKIVCRINNEHVQKCLLAESRLDYKKADSTGYGICITKFRATGIEIQFWEDYM